MPYGRKGVEIEKHIQVYTTFKTRKDAERVSDSLLRKRLASCVQIGGPIKSKYWWKNKLKKSNEWFCLVKSRKSLYGKVEREIKKLHPYKNPEIIAMPIVAGSKSYLDWISKETSAKGF